MASAYPVAIALLLVIGSAIVLPPVWWLVAWWQKGRQLRRLSVLSIALSFTPIVSALLLPLNVLPPAVTLIAFFVTPLLNLAALLVVTSISILLVRRRRGHGEA